jgi:hypothetical protein
MTHSSIDSILDPSAIEAIRASSTATCEILDPFTSSFSPVAITLARELTLEQLDVLRELLLNPQSWWFARKRCLPRPAALFRLKSDDASMTVLIEMPCMRWIVTGRWGGFFDPVQDQIREMIKRLFPEYASSSRRSMWKSGAIAQLRATGAADKDFA